jgi:hypothetical protein
MFLSDFIDGVTTQLFTDPVKKEDPALFVEDQEEPGSSVEN